LEITYLLSFPSPKTRTEKEEWTRKDRQLVIGLNGNAAEATIEQVERSNNLKKQNRKTKVTFNYF